MSEFYWRAEVNGAVPADAVPGGREPDGSSIFIGRAYHEGDLLPAKIVPSKGCAYVCWGGEEHCVCSYEVLCGAGGAWKPSSNGGVPCEAVHVGNTKEGEKLYVGRVWHEGSLVPGKVQPSHEVCYIPFGGAEIACREYEVLIP